MEFVDLYGADLNWPALTATWPDSVCSAIRKYAELIKPTITVAEETIIPLLCKQKC